MTSSVQRRRKTDFDPASNEWLLQVKRLQRKLAALQALQEAARSLTSELNVDQLLARTLESAVAVMQASAGSLLLHDAITNELVFRVVQGGMGEPLLNQRFPSHQGIAGSVFTSGKPSIVNNVALDDRFLKIGQDAQFATNSLLAVPLIYKGTPIGVMEILNKRSGERFDEDDEELLVAFAAQSAIAIENARLYQQVVAERDRMLIIEEEVRRELARDLHDGPSQLLAAIIMSLRYFRELLNRKPERSEGELANIEKLATQALQQIRTMLFNLRPVLLEAQGLGPALRAYVDQQRASHELEIYLEMDRFNTRLTPRAEGAVFSIVQEAIGNVYKHAQAKNAWIKLERKPDTLTIFVRDDGCGFDVAAVEAAYAQRGSLGLLNMKERAEIAGGTLIIKSAQGQGTEITLTVPIRQLSSN